MNRINNNQFFNYFRRNKINYILRDNIIFITKEQLEKLSHNEKFIECKCGKKPEFRWIEGELDKNKGLYHPIVPYKGHNNEELCHNCASFCFHCGREERSEGRKYYEFTRNNPSGEWFVRCCWECQSRLEIPLKDNYDGEIKSNPPAEGKPNPSSNFENQPWQGENCNYCGKLTKVKFANSPTEKTFCSRDCYVAAGNKIQKGKCRIAGCSREAYYECMDLCLGHSKPCQGGKIRSSGKICNVALGADEGDICKFCQNQQNDNSVKVNPGNSPKTNPGKDYPSEVKNNVKSIKLIKDKNDNQKIPANPAPEQSPENNHETLIIRLRNIKNIYITSNDCLVIEFNNSANIQTINSEEVNRNPELQRIKNYCQENQKTSLSQQELNSIFRTSTENSNNNNNKMLLIGVGIGGILVLGIIGIILLWKRKKVIQNYKHK